MRAFREDSEGNEKSWTTSRKMYTMEAIGEALKELVAATNSKGYYVSIVLDHKLLRHKTFTLPPMTPKDLEIYLARKISQLKEFEEEAIFSYTKTASSKGELIVSVNFLPKYYLEQLARVCLDAGVYLIQVVPLTRVMARRFQGVQIADDEQAALVDKLYHKVTMLIGKNDGSIFSDRSLLAQLERDEDMDRMAREINRSILFNKQMFSEKVALVKLSESFPDNFFAMVRKYVNIPVESSPKVHRFYWIQELLSIPVRDKGNLIPRMRQAEVRIRKHTRRVALILATFFLGAVISASVVEVLISRERQSLTLVEPQILVLQKQKKSWENRVAELEQLKRTIKRLDEERLPPLPGWFLGYLGNVLPDGLVLTKSRVRYSADRWEVLIEGISRKGHGKTARDLRKLSGDLKNGPFQVAVNDDWYQNWLKELRSGIISDDYQVSRFSLKGVIQ